MTRRLKKRVIYVLEVITSLKIKKKRKFPKTSKTLILTIRTKEV